MEPIVWWPPQMSVGIPAIDDAHKELLDEMRRLADTPDGEFGTRLFALIAKLERDFRVEEELMDEAGFPGLLGHREQHARLLGALHCIVPPVMEGNIDLGREAVALLPLWFAFHVSTMDAPLAFALRIAGVDPARPATSKNGADANYIRRPFSTA